MHASTRDCEYASLPDLPAARSHPLSLATTYGPENFSLPVRSTIKNVVKISPRLLHIYRVVSDASGETAECDRARASGRTGRFLNVLQRTYNIKFPLATC